MPAQGPNQMPSGTGNAPIKRVGHTANGQYGSGINDQPKGRKSATDLRLK